MIRTFFLSLFLTLLVGCASNPLAIAETANQRAYAVYGVGTSVAERANAAMQSDAVSNNVKRQIQSAAPRVQASMNAGTDLFLEGQLAVAEFQSCQAAGGNCSDLKGTLTYVASQIDDWIRSFVPLVKDFAATLEGN